MDKPTSMYNRHRFPPETIQHTVWLYHRFNLSGRDIEDLMAERGLDKKRAAELVIAILKSKKAEHCLL